MSHTVEVCSHYQTLNMNPWNVQLLCRMKVCLVFLLVGWSSLVHAGPHRNALLSSLPSLPDDAKAQANEKWRQTLELIWAAYRNKVSFCLGNDLEGVLALIQNSFPSPLPLAHDDSPICSNRTMLDAHICSPEEILLYYKFILLTDDVEKVPSNLQCRIGKEEPSCAPGFFAERVEVMSASGPQPCCGGYFCPVMLTCMIPCPLGAVCPRAFSSDPPKEYQQADAISKLVRDQDDKWCSPYGYKERKGQGCGGADKWSVLPQAAFPNMQWSGSGNIFCPGGWYCPDTTANPLPCEEGHFCKQGSTEMTRCPPLVNCPRFTVSPEDSYAGITMDACLFAALAVLWHMTGLYNRMVRKLNSKERIRVMWHRMTPHVTVVRVAEAHEGDLWDNSSEGSNRGRSGEAPIPLLTPHHSSTRDEGGAIAEVRSPLIRRLKFWDKGEGAEGSERQELERTGRGGPGPVWAQFEAPLMSQGEYHSLPDHELHSMTQEKMLENGVGSTLVLEPMPSWPSHQLASQRRFRLHVRFINLSMKLKSCGKRVLQNVTGEFHPGKMTAIMGPSGAGKTTLMCALAGKANYGSVTGTIQVNGRADRLERYKKVMGFVPQDDIMYRTLTVEENLHYSAHFRLPRTFSSRQRLEVVENAITVLGLGEIRHSIIGDEETRGISGGQRKRVNVGLELVADPVILFLDEPTSGLDSTASKLVVQGLRRVAQLGVTVVAVIHQPSYEVFCMFDDLVLLAKGGQTAYYGPQADVQAYFESLGFSIPAHVNPADAYMDIISGLVTAENGLEARPDVVGIWQRRVTEAGISQPLTRSMSGDSIWSAGSGRTENTSNSVGSRLQKMACLCFLCVYNYTRETVTTVVELVVSLVQRRLHRRSLDPVEDQELQERQVPGFCEQWYLCLCRAVAMRLREPMVVFTEYMIFALAGSMLGLMGDRGRGSILRFTGSIMYCIVGLGIMATVSSTKTFSQDRVVFFRESARGLNKLAYFWALETFDHAGTLLRAVVYMTMYYSFSQPRAVIWQMYVVTVAIVYCCTGTAYFLSQVFSLQAAQLTAAVWSLISALVAQKHNPVGLFKFVKKISYARWGLEGYVIAEANKLDGVWLLARCTDLTAMGYDVTQFWSCMRVLVYIGLGFRILAAACMMLLHRDKQL